MHHPRVHMLRSLEDAQQIDQALGHSKSRVLVIGGGFIGCQLASTCRTGGLGVSAASRELIAACTEVEPGNGPAGRNR